MQFARWLSRLSVWKATIAMVLLNPSLVQAAPKQVQVQLSAWFTPSFVTLMQQAELQATRIVQRTFSQDPSVTELTVQVVGERGGIAVPLLTTKVSRLDWQQTPNLQQWSKSFGVAAVLLGYARSALPPVAIKAPSFTVNQLSFARGETSPISDVEPNFYE
jgi:hypothetical protein